MLLKEYLIDLNDEDAGRAVYVMEGPLAELPLGTECGEACKRIVDRTWAWCQVIDEVLGQGWSLREEAWKRAVHAMRVILFG